MAAEELLPAVITVPASFTHQQRQSVKDAATIARIDVLQLLNEPTAAALLYAADSLEPSSCKSWSSG